MTREQNDPAVVATGSTEDVFARPRSWSRRRYCRAKLAMSDTDERCVCAL